MADAKTADSAAAGEAGGSGNDPKKTGVPPTRAVGTGTATGMAIQDGMGDQDIPKGKDAGSPQKIDGGDPPADLLGKPGKARGLQAEPAIFSSNGEIPSNHVASPSGPVPVAAVAGSPEEAKKAVERHREQHKRYVESRAEHKVLDENTINRLSKTELRAIGDARGYDMPVAGTRATRAAFSDAQKSAGGKMGRTGGRQSGNGGGGNKGGSKGSRGGNGGRATKTSTERATRRSAASTPRGTQRGSGSSSR